MRSPPVELLSECNSLGLPLGLEAPGTKPDGVIFLFFSFLFFSFLFFPFLFFSFLFFPFQFKDIGHRL